MSNIILEFLEAYKSLDKLCKQILSSDRGISEYIDEMSNERQGHMKVTCWEKDYKQLKKMRWIRNQLVHEPNSFQDSLVSVEDIKWLKNFRSRIMERTDPFSLLYQSKIIERKSSISSYSTINYPKMDKPSYSQNLTQEVIWGVIIGIGILAIIFFIVWCLMYLS